jgi:hypothetical protein
MAEVIYGVALNGTSSVIPYKVLLETPRTYTINRPAGSVVRKATMSDRWERYYTDKDEAEKFLAELLSRIDKSCKQLDIKYIYEELVTLIDEDDTAKKFRLKNLVKYLEEFL